MCIFKTDRESYTGKYLYSDVYVEIPGCAPDNPGPGVIETTFLTEVAAWPFVGIAMGAARVGLAIIHIIGHLGAAVYYCSIGHICHVLKGGTELLRGVIEMIPIVGRIFVWCYDARDCTGCCGWHNCSSQTLILKSFFIIKIYNAKTPDRIDKHLAANYSQIRELETAH